MFTKILWKMLKPDFIPDFEVNRPLPKGKNKKVIGLMKDKLGGQITK